MALDVEKLEQSFDLIAPRGQELVARFYQRLFEVAPEVRPLFDRVDMARQEESLLNTLVVLRESLRDLQEIVPDLEALGARHAGWGVKPEHYPIVGQVLLEAMAEIGGSQWKPEYTTAWADTYGVVQGVMLQGAGHA